ncbi:hypothetical protein GYB61_00765 [bacterium]|nr:hypothetical protein [bacterium]
MGTWGTSIRVLVASAGSMLLSACGGDLLGHPGAAQPDTARQHFSQEAHALIARSFAGLPAPLVDVAAWPQPGLRDALPAPWQHAAFDDATQGSMRHSLFRNQVALGHPVRAVVPFAKNRWPANANWQPRASNNAGAGTLWLDASAPDGAWREQLNEAPDGQRLVLVHCGAQQLDSLRACLQALRDDDNVWLALGGLTTRDASPASLMLLLQQTALHTRYRWSSAWPTPAINWLVWLRPLAKHGFIDPADIAPLREIYADNPLLFDVVLWRSIRLPGTEVGLPAEIFAGLPEAATDDDS